jgi:hypothetical protein
VDLERPVVLAIALLSISPSAHPYPADFDPFAILKPDVVIDAEERQALDGRKVVLKILPARQREVAVLAAGSVNATSAELSARVNDVVGLTRGPLIPQIGRFSNPPVLKDLDELTLDEVDLDAIKACRPGHCGLKLSDREIAEFHEAIRSADDASAASAIEHQFRYMMLSRVNAYLRQGLSGIGPYTTDHDEAGPGTAFATLVQHTPFLHLNAPELEAYLTRYPEAPLPGRTTSFLYWSKQKYTWKPIINVTQVTIVDSRRTDDLPELLIASNDVFATRYTSGALVLTFLLRGTDARTPHYLVYLNRTWVDGLQGWWRPFLDHRIKSQAVKVFATARERIEGGPRAATTP